MSEADKNELRFNHQFLLCKRFAQKKTIENWDSLEIGDEMLLYYHPNLEVIQMEMDGRSVTLIGFLLDPFDPQLTNENILSKLIEKTTFEELLHETFHLAGKFVIVFKDTNHFCLFHDAAGQREVFFFEGVEYSTCGSQPTIINEACRLNPCSESLQNQFYSSKAFQHRRVRINCSTQYEGLSRLAANHFLNLKKGKAIRYFPNKKIIPLNFEVAVRKCARLLKGFLEAASYRYKLMIAVTAGYDSRMMLAASHRLEDVTYFIFKHKHLTDNSLDIKTPKTLFEKLGKPFNVIEYDDQVDDLINTIMLQNVELMNKGHIAMQYNILFKKKGYMTITSVSEFARNYFHDASSPNKLSGQILASLNQFKGDEFVENQYDQWLAESRTIFEKCGYNTLDMFYWEEKMGNWMANGRSSMGNVIEDFSPLNCKEMMTLFLSVDEKFRKRYNPVFFKKIIETLYQEALLEPINNSLKYRTIIWLQKLKFYPVYKKVQMALRSS